MNVIKFPDAGGKSYFTGEPGGEEFVEYADDRNGNGWSMYLVRPNETPRRLAIFEDRESVEAFGAFLRREAARQA